ncbi:hypothetical protein N7532_001343 [Penicillium argentinense]|uniref:Mid2 domain-containing protein n=1 Tax=Penicillium argentinense TaxID=1131581 RepID=A0A9W9G2K1_9EURO|nr:uncharacterized protein N7532_001343 [Penicillium argentinense]KAJ5110808.1 hypothetical protein N7532_001343 [Penicillium argentinense]
MSRSRSFHLLFALVSFLLISVAIADNSTCYYPNGHKDKNYKKCPGDSLACCLEGESCLSNGLCFTANFGILYRGLCADKTWPISECPRVCYEEIPDKWANMFQCNTSHALFTCARDDVSAATACKPENALGTYTYTSANVTVAQNGKEVVNTTTSTNVTSSETSAETGTLSSSASSSSATCPATISYKNSQLVAIGAGLGAGLGIPLLIAAGLAIYCGGWKRRKLEQKQEQLQAQQQQVMVEPATYAGVNYKSSPPEVQGSIPHHEVMGSVSHGRSELPGST